MSWVEAMKKDVAAVAFPTIDLDAVGTVEVVFSYTQQMAAPDIFCISVMLSGHSGNMSQTREYTGTETVGFLREVMSRGSQHASSEQASSRDSL